MDQHIKKLYSLFLKNRLICTDTRKITRGCLFFALKGGNYNGNKFAAEALEKGAAYAIIDEEIYNKGPGFFLVPDVLNCLQQLSLYHRRKLNIPFIAITGSNGKTTTKELINAVLSMSYMTCSTTGNLNNHIGVPLTLLSVNDTHQMAVIEMGANHKNEIEFLCSLAEPDYGIITNIGKAHLEGFGGMEGVIKGKGELYSYLKSNGQTIIINPDQPLLVNLLADYSKRLTYGSKEEYDICGQLISSNNFLKVEWKSKSSEKVFEVKTNLTGEYNLNNILASICVGVHFKIPDEKIVQAIESYFPDNQRSQILNKGTNTIILDAYNANPTSMEAALKNINENYSGNKMLIIGGMLELGNESMKEHEAISAIIQKMKFSEILLVGENFKEFASKLKAHYFENSMEAKNWIQKKNFENTTVLIKGSRGLKMELTLEGF
jgi:UDP-N-acetylmuramoyl-tripeptide--D-alanyl-D-alanine ligase